MIRRLAVVTSQAEVAVPDELRAGHRVGRLLGENGITLVFDGSAVGAAGAVAFLRKRDLVASLVPTIRAVLDERRAAA